MFGFTKRAATTCNCSDCRIARDDFASPQVQRDNFVPTLRREASKPEIAGIRAVRKAFIEYKKNPHKYIDFTQSVPAYNTYGDLMPDYMAFAVKTFEEVCGIRALGAGCYSEVYSISDKYVLKVVKNTDEGYARFVRLIRQYPTNPHFPKVLYSGVWAGKQVYVLERLTTYPDNGDSSLNGHFRSAINSWNGRGRKGNPFFGGYKDPAIEETARLLNEHNMTGDLHGGNVMFRGDVPVVTDPCTY